MKKPGGYQNLVVYQLAVSIYNLTVIFCLIILTLFVPEAEAQGFDIASTYQIQDKEAVTGDILMAAPNHGLTRANTPYSNTLFGILQDQPVVVFKETDNSGRAVVRTGDAVVNVSDFNGEIKPGDYITSSPISGLGMKATRSGYVIGVATSIFTQNDTTQLTPEQIKLKESSDKNSSIKTGQINVALRIEYAEISTPRTAQRLLENVGGAFYTNVQNPQSFTQVIKYTIAGILAIVAFLLGFFTFARSIPKGIEAMGRNPTAKQAIQISIIIQTGLTVFTILIGLLLVFIIIRL